MNDLCEVCCDLFGKKRVKVTCFKCNFNICSYCLKKWLLSDFNNGLIPNCINCSKGFTRSFLCSSLGTHWINTVYDSYKGNLLFEYQLSRLHELHKYVIYEKNIDNWYLKNNYTIFNKYSSSDNELLIRSISKNRKLKNLLLKELYEIRDPLPELKFGNNEIYFINIDPSHASEHINEIVICNCPEKLCKGVIRSDWKCSICQIKVCNKCQMIEEVAGSSHVCDPEIVKSILLIKKDTKSCPICYTRVHRIDGCNQMWCTACNTAFNYKTEKVLKLNKIYNPHFDEYVQKIKDNYEGLFKLDNSEEYSKITSCEFIEKDLILEKIDKYFTRDIVVLFEKYFNATEKILLDKKENSIKFYDDLGLLYLKDKITLNHYRSLIKRKEKSFSKKNEINSVYKIWALCIKNILYNFISSMIDKQAMLSLIYECDNITMDALDEISNIYNSKNVKFPVTSFMFDAILFNSFMYLR